MKIEYNEKGNAGTLALLEAYSAAFNGEGIYLDPACNPGLSLTLTRPIGLPPHAPVAQKIADQR